MKNLFKILIRKPSYVYFTIALSPYVVSLGILMLFGLGFYQASFTAVVFYLLLAIVCFRPLLGAAIEAGIEDGFESALKEIRARGNGNNG